MANSLHQRCIAVGVGGGIAAYKTCDLVREFVKEGALVRVAMTRAAREFVTPLSFQALSGHPVLTDYFDSSQERSFGHLDLARWAEVYVVAPATADLLARIRWGLADDPVTTSLLAFRGRVVLAPAMNVAMFENAITQANLRALSGDARFQIVGPDTGPLADGETGPGRLAEVKVIAKEAAELLHVKDLTGKKVTITAGPTREHFDPVRYLSNPSSGKMGIALARAARDRGAEVTLVVGPSNIEVPPGIEVVRVTTADEMAEACLSATDSADYFIASAAVSDYRPEQRLAQKKKKINEKEQVTLVRTRDALAEVATKLRKKRPQTVIVGFAAETQNVLENAAAKMNKKELDLIVANDVTAAGAGFGGDNNQVTILSRDGKSNALTGTKAEVARRIWDIAVAYADTRSGKSGSESRP